MKPSHGEAQSSNPVLPLFEPKIGGNEWKYVRECLDTNQVSSIGAYVNHFEQIVADYVGARFAVATVSGTSSLHIALLVAGVQSDDEVLVSTLTFVAPANAIRYIGAWPVFIDAEPDYWQMDPQKVVDFIELECKWRGGALYNKTSGRCVKAILPVHILGHPVDMQPILDVARKYGLAVVEDAAESLGSRQREIAVGNLGDIACFSFNGNKIITAGGGGMIVTDNEAWAQRARHLTTQAKCDPLEYIHDEIGYNYRMTNIHAAIAVAQMEQLDSFIEKKRQIAANYAEGLGQVEYLSLMPEAEYAFGTYWLYTILLNPLNLERDSRYLISGLNARGIQSRPLWLPVHRQPMYRDCAFYGMNCADHLNALAVQLPSSVDITTQQIERVIGEVLDICGG